jgi:predicted enzyme related to lactoylglutathione lyase
MQDMSQPSAHRHHAIDYVELTVTDLEQAKRFYSEAFGWRFNDYGPEYAGIQSPQGESAPEVGGLRADQEVRAGGPFVLLYSTDLNRSVEAVKHAGGQVVNGPYEFPGGRRFHFADPSGNELGVWAEAWRAGRHQAVAAERDEPSLGREASGVRVMPHLGPPTQPRSAATASTTAWSV